ncbi:MAG: MFS transporter [Bacteroidota bacterium]|jgi:MFS family permease
MGSSQIPASTIGDTSVTDSALRHKGRMLLIIALAEFLGMSVWFSASAVIPALTADWHLTGSDQAWLTMSVQAGFVVGALASSLFNVADYVPGHILFAATSFLAAFATALIPFLAPGLTMTLVLRFFTGLLLAGVYPVGMKIVATWTMEDRGFGIGVLVGALTLGSAAPHLLNALGGIKSWQPVLYIAAALAFLGGGITLLFVREGPYRTPFRRFNWKYVGQIFRQRDLFLANLGYLGHMWELYAMWAWIPIFLLKSFELNHIRPVWASLAAFAVIGIGGAGSIVAGYLADRVGRTTITMVSMAISGLCALTAGFLFGGNPTLLIVLCLVWGFAVVADSAQFSACVTELCQTEYIGTALTLQTSLGFLLTLVTIRLIPVFVNLIGWSWAFAFLSIGPALGVLAMGILRTLPTAHQLAGGKK